MADPTYLTRPVTDEQLDLLRAVHHDTYDPAEWDQEMVTACVEWDLVDRTTGNGLELAPHGRHTLGRKDGIPELLPRPDA